MVPQWWLADDTDEAARTGKPPRRLAARMDLPDGDTHGASHVETALQDLEFPMTKEELLSRAGEWRIPLTGARFVELRDLLAGADKERFESAEEVADAVRRR